MPCAPKLQKVHKPAQSAAIGFVLHPRYPRLTFFLHKLAQRSNRC
jgi:hypothetical protein